MRDEKGFYMGMGKKYCIELGVRSVIYFKTYVSELLYTGCFATLK
jgi:hypothetical protein